MQAIDTHLKDAHANFDVVFEIDPEDLDSVPKGRRGSGLMCLDYRWFELELAYSRCNTSESSNKSIPTGCVKFIWVFTHPVIHDSTVSMSVNGSSGNLSAKILVLIDCMPPVRLQREQELQNINI